MHTLHSMLPLRPLHSLCVILLAGLAAAQTCVPANTLTFSSSDRILVNGARMNVKGIAWYGFEGASYCVEGLNTRPLGDILDLVKSNNFNVIRIPFAADVVYNLNSRYPSNIDYSINPALQGMTSIQVLDQIFIQAAARGLLIMLDMHLFDESQYNDQPAVWYSNDCQYDSGGFCDQSTPSCVTNKDGVCVDYTEQVNKNIWYTLVNRYKSNWNFFAADIQNEIHEPATWGSGDSTTDYAAAAERISNDIFTRNSDYRGLVFIEGIGNVPLSPYCENHTATGQAGGHWWGGNLEPVRCRPLGLANGMTNRLVYSPHVYGPSVYNQAYFQEAAFPGNMPAIWDDHFGSVRLLTNKAVVVGEWGGPNTGTTATWLNAFASYLISKDMTDNFHWSLNPNRDSDTPGVLLDWYTPDQDRMTLLAHVQPSPTTFSVSGSNVCYSAASSSAPSVTSSAAGSNAVTSSAAGSAASTSSSSSSSFSSSSSAHATTAAVSYGSTTSTSSSSGTSASCVVSVTQSVSSTWVSGGATYYQYSVTVSNTSPSQSISALSMRVSSIPTQYWTATKNADGTFGLPSYMSSFAPGQSFSWGYTVVGTTTINVVSPACGTASPAATSASAASTSSAANSISSSSSSSSSAAAATTAVTSSTTSGAAVHSPSTTSAASTSAAATTTGVARPSGSTTGTASSGKCTLSFTQSVSSSWSNAGQPAESVSAVMTNTGSAPITALKFFLSAAPTQIWGVTANADGSFTFPSYTTSIPAGGQLQFGYNANANGPLTIIVASPSGC